MDFTLSEVVSWLIVGGLAGSLVGLVIRGRGGFGHWRNLGIGLVGAVIGGAVLGILDLDLGLGEVKVTLESLLAALLGSLVFLAVLWFLRRKKKAA